MKFKVKNVSLLEDLRDIKTLANKRIKKLAIFRSSHFAKIEKGQDEVLFNKYHLHHVVDFRTDEEITKMPELEGSVINHYHFPMLENHENRMITKENRLRILKEMSRTEGGARARMSDFYELLITSKKAQKAYRNFFDVLLKAKDGEAVAFHCTQGKDRTGIALMLLLTVLGVDKQTIIDRYMKFNKLTFWFRFWVFVGMFLFKTPKLAFNLDRIIGTRREYIERSYATIERDYQNIDNYIRTSIGLTDEEIQILRSQYLY